MSPNASNDELSFSLSSMRIKQFDGTNYQSWSVRAEMALEDKDLWDVTIDQGLAERILGSRFEGSAGKAELAKATDSDFKSNRKAYRLLCSLINDEQLVPLLEYKTAYELWVHIKKASELVGLTNALHLRREVMGLKMDKGSSVRSHATKLVLLFQKLAAAGDPVGQNERVVILLSSLPDAYGNFVTVLDFVDKNKLTWDYVINKLETEELKLGKGSPAKGLALNTTNRWPAKKPSFKFAGNCNYCAKMGHKESECRGKQSDIKNGTTKNRKSAAGAAAIAFMARSNDLQTGLVWLVDSGATDHLVSEKNVLENYRDLATHKTFTVADNRKIAAVGMGDYSMMVLNKNGSSSNLIIKDILYVPGLGSNLLSVPKITQKGYSVEFKKNCCLFKRDSEVVAIAKERNGVYVIEDLGGQAMTVSEPASIQVWHERMGHLNQKAVKQLAKGLATGINLGGTADFDCDPCVQGKHAASPFPNDPNKKPASGLLDLVHSDVCGPIDPESLGGSKYFVTFIDDHSRYTTVVPLAKKSDVLNAFKTWESGITNKTGRRIKTLRTDNGGEYISTLMKEYLNSRGIHHELTIPYTPQQNGLAERMNRTLVEAVRTMLIGSTSPKTLWAEALATAAYLKNRSPTAALDKTPFKIMTGRTPDLSHLRTFGSKCFFKAQDSDRNSKLDGKSLEGRFVGYSDDSKAYRIFYNDHIRLSRNVVFREDVNRPQIVYVPVTYDSDDDLTEDESEPDPSPKSVFDSEDNLTEDEEPATEVIDPATPPPQKYQLRSQTGLRKTDSPAPFTSSSKIARSPPGKACLVVSEPKTYASAMRTNESALWHKACQSEIDSLHKNQTWELVPRPSGRKIIGSRWVMKTKLAPDGSIDRFKARLVAKGYDQIEGIDYEETFAPVAKFDSVRLILAIAVEMELSLSQMDVVAAFLNGTLDETIYMEQPEGFVEGDKNMVCKLHKSLYGLKQSPRQWNVTIVEFMLLNGFTQTASDHCIFIKRKDSSLILVALYVDDLIIATNDPVGVSDFKIALASKFAMKDLGDLRYVLGLEVNHDRQAKTLTLHQHRYLADVLVKFKMEDCRPVATPMESKLQLVKLTERSEDQDSIPYRSAVGSFIYAMVATRPDIAASVGVVSRHAEKHDQSHWIAVKRIMRYLNGTLDLGIKYQASGKKQVTIEGFSDADWAGDTDDRRSTTGYIFRLAGGAVSWNSKKQTTVALSTVEAEYMALASATQEAIWIRALLKELGFPQLTTVIWEDNQGCIKLAKNPVAHKRTKHIDIRHHFLRERITEGDIEVNYVPTAEICADMLTKALAKDQFIKLLDLIGMVSNKSGSSGSVESKSQGLRHDQDLGSLHWAKGNAKNVNQGLAPHAAQSN